MAFTEFYCQSGGSNLNSGSDTSNTAKYTSTNGNWSTVTDVFTPTDGTNPVTAGVAVGDFASIYIDGATVGVFIGLITAVTNAVNGPITISTTSRAGTAPVTSTTTRTIKVGGACKGPNAGQGYQISLNGLGSLKDASGHTPRFNLKNDATYSITTGITVVGTVLWIQGYSTTPGDKGRAIIDGGTSLITPLALGTSNVAADLIVQNNGSSGSANGINVGQQNAIIRCVVHNVRGAGFNVTNTFSTLIECEAYSCNQSNTVGSGGFVASSETTFINCISHDNTGSNNDGFTTVTNASAVSFIRCISDSNGRPGFSILIGISGFTFFNCDSYNNGTDGIRFTNATSNISNATFRNCNFIKNGGYGLNTSLTTANMWGVMDNCGFGSGTMANVSGD